MGRRTVVGLAGVELAEPVDRETRRRRSHAKTWRFSPQMEKLAQLKETDPEAYGRLRPNLHLRLGHYLIEKAAAEAEGIDTRDPDAPPAAPEADE